MAYRLGALLGALLLGSVNHVMAADGGASPSALLDRELAAVVNDAQHPLSGLSVLAIRDGKVSYQQQFGLRRIDTTGHGKAEPVTAATMFRIASISKMMTTLGLMRLVEEGKIDLDADISGYLGFTVRNPHFPDRAVTLRQVLSHTASLRDDAGYSWGTDTALKDVLVPGGARHGKGEMWARNAGPGDYFTYSNLGWGVIGTVMEKVTGERFDLLMRRLLLNPLGLRGGYNTSAFSPAEVADTSTLYRRRTTDTEIWNPAGPWIAQVDDFGVKPPSPPARLASYVPGTNATLFSPTGGLRISAPDMGKVMLMLINKGRHEGKVFLKPETLALMFQEQWRYNGKNGDTLNGLYHSWGLGTQRFPDEPGVGNRLVEGGGFSAVGHLGEAYGLISTFVVDLQNGNGMVSLIGGFGTDPDQRPGAFSAHTRSEELILNALYRRAILGKVD
ncbi:serine hydrolase domain-containing protein [Massilia endophytica]|uniref:serine hydrolase domain-containing protein n=1 Tax=Massilia endophytica TaxID=2899220 RepID=UPI001E4FA976|nr:serine hydrolase [Massilia endophytica]UGQ46478.1 beta-lactamase family protein [Massilia endophytica]